MKTASDLIETAAQSILNKRDLVHVLIDYVTCFTSSIVNLITATGIQINQNRS